MAEEFGRIKVPADDHAEYRSLAATAKPKKTMQEFLRVLLDCYKKNNKKKGKAPTL